ncbi:DUF2312 domain-containing protein [Sphingomonas sp. PB4P5]|uniref:DUF2312 domain-containing protein n=1 Tax=Parasphingomonas puruogangriensis TaxID=3096155 RepID=UPI003FA71E48
MSAMTMRAVPDGNGGFRHVPTPFVPQLVPTGGKKKKAVVPDPINTNGEAAAEQLRLLIEALERLHEEKAGIADDISDKLAEAKATGYDTKAIRAMLTLRKQEKHHRDEFEGILETYKIALGLA